MKTRSDSVKENSESVTPEEVSEAGGTSLVYHQHPAGCPDASRQGVCPGHPRAGLDRSLRELQQEVRDTWTLSTYAPTFLANPLKHRDFAHSLLHVTKAAGKIAAFIDDQEHSGADQFSLVVLDSYIADLVICAMRMANTCPGRVVDLAESCGETTS